MYSNLNEVSASVHFEFKVAIDVGNGSGYQGSVGVGEYRDGCKLEWIACFLVCDLSRDCCFETLLLLKTTAFAGLSMQ